MDYYSLLSNTSNQLYFRPRLKRTEPPVDDVFKNLISIIQLPVELNAFEMPLDTFQRVFFLSAASNLVKDDLGTQELLQKILQQSLNSVLPVTVPGWKVVWGPVVWKNKPDEATTGPDNSWYVAYHPNFRFEDNSEHPTYVIAIAGTPPGAEYVWTNQNFGVDTVADFSEWVTAGVQSQPNVVPAARIVPGTPYIATGTVNAVHLLLTTPAPEGAEEARKTLFDYINYVDKPDNVRFITTGHSLGGVLSPPLALSLVLAGVITAENTLTYPTAALSPGNRGFTDLFTATFPARKSDTAKSYQGWNLNLVNTLDPIPQAWCPFELLCPEQNLANIPPIYGKPVLPLVQGGALVLAIHALRSGVFYFPLPSQCFTGCTPPNPPADLDEFIEIAIPAHIGAYFDEVGITDPARNESGLPHKSKIQRRFDFPIIAELEWAREHPQEAQKEIDEIEHRGEAKAFRNDV